MRSCQSRAAADAVGGRSVLDMQSTGSLIAYAEWVHNATLEPSIVTLASYVDLLTSFRRGVPDESATHGRQERVPQSYIHRCVEGGEQRQSADDLWSQIIRWDVQSAGSAARRPKDDFHARNLEGCDEVAAAGTSRDRPVGREEKSGTRHVQSCTAVKHVPGWQRDGAMTLIWQPSSATLAEDELERKARGVEQSVVPGAGPKGAPSESERPQGSGACEIQRFSRL